MMNGDGSGEINWAVFIGLGLLLLVFCALGWFTVEDVIDLIGDILSGDD